jgi:dehydrogenase/reductase SDR family protein 13
MSTASLEGKTFVITGANTGIGRACAIALAARKPARVVIAARSRERTQPVLDEMAKLSPDTALDYVSLDLTSLADVRRAADEILTADRPIDVLINNAGIAGVRGETQDGFELAWGTNHVGHYLFTEKLLPLVKRAPQGRIVNVSSRGHMRAKNIDWDAVKKPSATVSAFPEYCVSKLANVLHAKELARRLAGSTVTTYSLHPGGVASDIWSRRLGPFAVLLKPFLITNEEGAKTQVHCATATSLAKESGLYYYNEKPTSTNPLAESLELQDKLREKSDEWVEAFVS